MTFCQVRMSADDLLEIKTLNDVAVGYCRLGLKDLACQIWEELYYAVQKNREDCAELVPVISCNLGSMLLQADDYEEAYQVLRQGLRCCFGTGRTYAMPELLLQVSMADMKLGKTESAQSLYAFAKEIFRWSGHCNIGRSMDEAMEQDFLLCYHKPS